MAKADGEISHWPEYDYVIVNDDVGRAQIGIQQILAAERSRRTRQTNLADYVSSLTNQTGFCLRDQIRKARNRARLSKCISGHSANKIKKAVCAAPCNGNDARQSAFGENILPRCVTKRSRGSQELAAPAPTLRTAAQAARIVCSDAWNRGGGSCVAPPDRGAVKGSAPRGP